jgi:hypothetical protein
LVGYGWHISLIVQVGYQDNPYTIGLASLLLGENVKNVGDNSFAIFFLTSLDDVWIRIGY